MFAFFRAMKALMSHDARVFLLMKIAFDQRNEARAARKYTHEFSIIERYSALFLPY